MKKRANGKGSAVYLGSGRYKPWAARITIGKTKDGKPIYYDIDTFEDQLGALVCLENYHTTPYPLKIKQEKYDRIATFSRQNYPLVPVENITTDIHRKNKKNYTFKQVFEEFKENMFPTKEEIQIEKNLHIKPDGKLAYSNSNHMITAYNQCQILYDTIYCELKTSDFKKCINNPKVKMTTKGEMVKLFKHMDSYAYAEDIISKKYSESLKSITINTKTRNPFTHSEVKRLWDIEENNNPDIQFVRDFLLLTCYTGCRAEELLFLYSKNIFLEENYFITGLKTEAGTNRIVPIHTLIKHIIEKYYNKTNQFLFISQTGNKMSYATYMQRYKRFKEKYPEFEGRTAHCGRHSVETELQKLNVKSTIINSILGHKNGNVPDDVYNHISIEEKIEAINLLTYKDTKLYIFNSQNTDITSQEKTQ